MNAERYDYIVVGGGSAGCIAAAELSADPSIKVLLLEAGDRAEAHPETLRADGYKYAFANDALIWERFSVKQPACGRQRVFMGTGTGLGGSGSVNGMVYIRGAREYTVFTKRDYEPSRFPMSAGGSSLLSRGGAGRTLVPR